MVASALSIVNVGPLLETTKISLFLQGEITYNFFFLSVPTIFLLFVKSVTKDYQMIEFKGVCLL